MSEPLIVPCPNCRAKLKLKNRSAAGTMVPCPRCGEPVVLSGPEAVESSPKDLAPSGRPGLAGPESAPAPLPPLVRKKKRRAASSRKKARRQPTEAELRRDRWAAALAGAIWWNAHLAAGVCLVDSAVEFVSLITHWDEVYRQVGIGRLAVRRVGRPVFVFLITAIVWFQLVLPRDRGVRGAAAVVGGAYLLLFGLLAALIAVLASSVYERPVYAIQWSAVYFGLSLLAYALWGFGPETARQRAERLMAGGRYGDALSAIEQALEDDPDDEDALELERTLRDLARYG